VLRHLHCLHPLCIYLQQRSPNHTRTSKWDDVPPYLWVKNARLARSNIWLCCTRVLSSNRSQIPYIQDTNYRNHYKSNLQGTKKENHAFNYLTSRSHWLRWPFPLTCIHACPHYQHAVAMWQSGPHPRTTRERSSGMPSTSTYSCPRIRLACKTLFLHQLTGWYASTECDSENELEQYCKLIFQLRDQVVGADGLN
jgi:hypothetical protein